MKIDYKCAKCNVELTTAVAAGVDPRPPQISDILLCAGCGMPNVVTLEGTREITEEEFAQLDPEEQRDLDFIQRSMIKEKLPKNGTRHP